MPIPSESADRLTTVDPDKWLAMLQRWHPREPREVFVDFINSFIEAAGPQRVEGLDALFVHTDETTRSAREKFDTLLGWRDEMRSDPRCWPHLVKRGRPVLILVKKIVDESPRPLDRFEVERKFRKFRKVPPTGLQQELKELAKRGEIDRHKAGVYWRQGTAPAPYESLAQRAYRLVYSAADQRMREAELADALGISRKEAATQVSHSRKRGLFAPATGDGVVVTSAESLATLQRGPIFDGRGGIFFAPARPAPLDAAIFTTLRPERPRVDPHEYVADIARLATLSDEDCAAELDAAGRRWGRPEEEILGLVQAQRGQRAVATAPPSTVNPDLSPQVRDCRDFLIEVASHHREHSPVRIQPDLIGIAQWLFPGLSVRDFRYAQRHGEAVSQFLRNWSKARRRSKRIS